MNQRPDSEIKQRMKYVAGDLFASAFAFFVFNVLRYSILKGKNQILVSFQDFIFSPKLIVEEIIVPILMLGVYWLSGYYNRPFGKSRLEEITTTLTSALINTVWIYLVFLINDLTGFRKINYELIIVLFGSLAFFTYMVRIAITGIARMHFRKSQWKFRTLIIGDSPQARATAYSLEHDSLREGYNVVGYYPVEGEDNTNDSLTLPRHISLSQFCKNNKVDQIVIALQERDESKVLNILYDLFILNIPVKISPDTLSFLTSSIRLKDVYAEPFIDLTSPSITESSKNIKRVCDVVLSILALLILSPVIICVAIGVKRSSPGKIFYYQERIGKRQKPFRIYKFRTMCENAERDIPALTVKDDKRITPIGRILRKYRIDEIPQFWNVIKGDMSIVGPRPEREYFIKQIVKKAPYYSLVYQVRPGITSWGMVKYGYASSVEEMVERTRYDLIYLSNMSLFIDVKILIYTLRTLLRGEGK
ncbi:MAG: sugar transferase [Muribaculaceae bacterium]|nr:sugar transferase [Muribaculaceae bacterium]MDE6793129.1 sugar transferase [Muribaculaceae bacterium]